METTTHEKALPAFELYEEMRHQLDRHGLTDWSCSINRRTKTIYGRCFYRERRIEVSWQLAQLNGFEETYDTIKHEVAHALAGPKAGHGPDWKQACEITGAKPQACFDSKTVATPWTYAVVCDGCGKTAAHRNRNNKKPYFHFANDCLPELAEKQEARRLRWVHRDDLGGE